MPPRCRVSKPQAKAAQMRLSLPSWRPSRALLHKNPLESVITPDLRSRQPIGGALSLATSAGSSLAGDGSLSAKTPTLAFWLSASLSALGSSPAKTPTLAFWLSASGLAGSAFLMIFSAGLLRSLTRNNFSDTNEKLLHVTKTGARCRHVAA